MLKTDTIAKLAEIFEAQKAMERLHDELSKLMCRDTEGALSVCGYHYTRVQAYNQGNLSADDVRELLSSISDGGYVGLDWADPDDQQACYNYSVAHMPMCIVVSTKEPEEVW